ncbi:uncharacterized protein BP5553_06014 [Venustampulla echinocandica]|uniref:Uncharacterized protein n=1 Tax=Venustampulla echinocandica TaxID=2656787 RepID=A0A370TMB6_9HELO|nr:uncharacterized protein BP5553_06014 [Venustampulla echinocandica]RDL36662.1 hypothetical protein BP5553_06014 [Venustampulla echinocandica]
MEGSGTLPEPILNIQQSLRSYIKPRQEVAHVRRILASNLNSSLNPAGERHLPQPLSLVDSSCLVDSTVQGPRGIRKEYIRCVRSNINARREYAQVGKDHNIKTVGRDPMKRLSDDSTANFLDLVKQEQKHEVLRIVQSYIDMLSKKPAATAHRLDPKLVLKNVESLPQIPPEVMNVPGASERSGGADLNELVDQLEKSVLRAKMLLKREQKLLTGVRSRQETSKTNQASKLRALGTARNELIHWIETELSRAGESSPEVDEPVHVSEPEIVGREYIDNHLTAIRQQYARYTEGRQALLNATTGQLDNPSGTATDEDPELPLGTFESPGNENAMSHITYPYLEKLLSVSNEQKATIQQKSHLTIGLAKQQKEAGQDLDRLADESHLLRAYPVPIKASRRSGMEVSSSFAEGMSNLEKPDSSQRVQPWVHASGSAATATKAAILEKLDEGSMAIDGTQQIFLDLRRLLGDDSGASKNVTDRADLRHASTSRDMWVEIDGTLGAIKHEE